MSIKTESNSSRKVSHEEKSLEDISSSSGASVSISGKPKPNSKIDLNQLGYAERRREARRSKPGEVTFDELGNAQYQWKDTRMLEESSEGETRRMRALALANLVLVDDEPPPDLKTIATNTEGLRLGYNPYESGKLEKKAWKKKRDLHALSQWIEARKKTGGSKD